MVSELLLWWLGVLADLEDGEYPQDSVSRLVLPPVHLIPDMIVIQSPVLDRSQVLYLLLICIIFNSNNDDGSRSFERIQRRAARTLDHSLHSTQIEHATPLIQTLQWLLISLGVKAKVLTLVHKANITPSHQLCLPNPAPQGRQECSASGLCTLFPVPWMLSVAPFLTSRSSLRPHPFGNSPQPPSQFYFLPEHLLLPTPCLP